MLADGWNRDLIQIRELPLREPDRSIDEPDVDARDAVIGLIEDQLRLVICVLARILRGIFASSRSHARSRIQVARSVASRVNKARVLDRTSVYGLPVRRVTWVTGSS
jgi:hypothetical protein